ncbi:MAG: transketolase-like TK C-terminal-containing protein, partial [Burkholderiales bacterium]
RQNLTFHTRTDAMVENISAGGYVLSDANVVPRVVLIATGSEVDLAVQAKAKLDAAGIATRVVSMPCTALFDRQDAAYRERVLPRGIPRVAIEAGVTDGWYKYVGLEGAVIGIDRFGESAPAKDLFNHFGFTPDHVVATVRKLLGA